MSGRVAQLNVSSHSQLLLTASRLRVNSTPRPALSQSYATLEYSTNQREGKESPVWRKTPPLYRKEWVRLKKQWCGKRRLDALPGLTEAKRKKFNVFLVVAPCLNSVIKYWFLGWWRGNVHLCRAVLNGVLQHVNIVFFCLWQMIKW